VTAPGLPSFGAGGRIFIVAEAGVNHNGDPALARRLVDAAAESGADAVKFQTFRVDALLTRGAPKAGYQVETTGAGESQREMLARLELADEPRLLSVTAMPLADVASVKDLLRALPASTPRYVDTDDRRELHMTIEVRDGGDNWLGDVQFVWGA